MKKLAAIVLLLLCLVYWYLHPTKPTSLPEKSDESLSKSVDVSEPKKVVQLEEPKALAQPERTDELICREEDFETAALVAPEELICTEEELSEQQAAIPAAPILVPVPEVEEQNKIVHETGVEEPEFDEYFSESEALSELEEVVLSEVVPETHLEKTEQYIVEDQSLAVTEEVKESLAQEEEMRTRDEEKEPLAQSEEEELEIVEPVESLAQSEKAIDEDEKYWEPVVGADETIPLAMSEEVQESLVQDEESQEPIAEADFPLAQTEELESAEPFAQCEVPEVETAEPLAQCEVSEVEVAEPLAQCEVLEVETAEPLAQCEVPEVKMAEPLAQCEVPEVETAEPLAQCEVPEVKTAEPITQSEKIERKPVEELARIEALRRYQSPDEPLEILENLRGILFLGDWNLARKEPVDCIEGVSSRGVGLFDAHPEFKRELQRRFIGYPLTEETIEEIKETVANFYASYHQPFVIVSIPKQEVTQGVLQVVVDEAHLGEIRCKGNQHFTSQDLLHYLRAKPGDPVIAKTIVEDVAFMNQNPFRHTDVLFTPGKKSGTTDLELITVDRWPYRIYAGADNTGTISTQRNRIFFGFNFGKTIIRDSEMSFQYTASPNVNRFYAYTGLFRIPFPWRHTLQGYGGYTKVHPNTETHKLYQRGVSWQVDLRYRIPLFEVPNLLQEVVLGYDFKETNNDILFSGENIFHGDADINQFMVGYELGNRGRRRKITFQAELYGNPGGMTTQNKNSSYQKLRYEAQSRYVYLRINQSLMQESISGFFLSYNFSGQIATTNLLPSEQLTMTGYNAVRGFEERILNLDNAAILNLTMELPHFSPAHLMGFKRYDDFYIHVFADAGLGGNHRQMPGEHRFYSLGSVGPGARYQFGRYCSARFDYGVQLWHQNFNPVTNSRYNFGLVLSY